MSKFVAKSVNGTIKTVEIDQLEDGSSDLILPTGTTEGIALYQDGSTVVFREDSRIAAVIMDQR